MHENFTLSFWITKDKGSTIHTQQIQIGNMLLATTDSNGHPCELTVVALDGYY